ESPAESVLVQGDTLRLEQVLTNLLNNALSHSSSERIGVRVRTIDGQAEVAVQDYGRGIPEANQAHLFDPFYQVRTGTSSSEGMGLGLYISQEIAKAHGGTLAVASAEGQGA